MSNKIANLFSDLFTNAPLLAEGEAKWECYGIKGNRIDVTISEGPYNTFRLYVEVVENNIPVMDMFLTSDKMDDMIDNLCIADWTRQTRKAQKNK